MSKIKAYLIVYYTYALLMSIPLVVVGYIFDIIPFVLASTIITNQIRSVSYGLHLTNGKCMYLTTMLIIIIGYLSKTIQLEWSFFIVLICVRDIYVKAPLKLIVKNKDRKWHENRIMLLLSIYLTLAIIGLYFDLYIITSSILWSIIMVDLTLILNNNE